MRSARDFAKCLCLPTDKQICPKGRMLPKYLRLMILGRDTA